MPCFTPLYFQAVWGEFLYLLFHWLHCQGWRPGCRSHWVGEEHTCHGMPGAEGLANQGDNFTTLF